ncbi:MAG: hypothetical protein ACUVSL_01840 [Chloroflexus sp.]|uniref:hypothetical protein n=1 Tax=Chloroflexus sp. TaxID=1904827 RepID=UPI00404959A6
MQQNQHSPAHYEVLRLDVIDLSFTQSRLWEQAPRTFGADQVACVKLTTIDP